MRPIAMTTVFGFASCLLVAPAFGEELCKITDGPTKSETEIREMLVKVGYVDIRKIEEEHGCVEAKGTDKDGKRFEVYVHPNTGEIVKIK